MSRTLEPITDEQRDEFNRDELNAIAASEGVESPESLRTKADVVAAINEKRAALASGGAGTTDPTTAPRDPNAGAPAGSNPPRDDRAPAATTLNTTGHVSAVNPTAESVFGGEVPLGAFLAYDTSAFQPREGETPVYGDARTRTLVDPDAKRIDTGKPVTRDDGNRDKGNE